MTPEEYLQQVGAMMQMVDGLTVTAEDPVETTLGPLSGVQMNMTTVADATGLTTAMSYFVSAKDGYLLVYFLSSSSQEGAERPCWICWDRSKRFRPDRHFCN